MAKKTRARVPGSERHRAQPAQSQARSRVPKKRPRPQPPASAADTFTIVGIGASAGGFEAFTALLRALPPDPQLAIVFVQHLAPQRESALVSLLSTQTELPVLQAEERMRVERNHVYVIPPDTQLVIANEVLHLAARPTDASQHNPVDAFFASLAHSAGPRAVAVVLSGTASDGARGIGEMKAAGGITIAQTPESAKYDGMPRAAIATGLVDLVLTPRQIGATLTQLGSHALAQKTDAAVARTDVSESQLQEIYSLLRPASGVDFRHYKLPTIKRRLFRRMSLHHLTDVDAYIRMLQDDGAEVGHLYRDLLIHVTRFFREPESFETLARLAFPAVVTGRPAEEPIRIWVPGCSTGEEPYSLAIQLVEFLARQQSNAKVQIFGTDVSEAAVEHARAGIYPASIEAHLSDDCLRRYFTKTESGYRVTKTIRDLCVFARQDLTKDPPFSRLDLIVCRNVLIYMDLVLQKKLLSVFHYALKPGGFLVLGQAETVGSQGALFSVVDKKFRIHRKRPNSGLPAVAFPIDYATMSAARKPSRSEPVPAEKALQSEVNRIINDRFSPPGVVVDADMQIVQFRGQTGAFLEPAPGDASLSLLKMAKEGLLHGLRSALNAARKSAATVRRDGLRVRDGKRWIHTDVEVIPLAPGGRAHYLVLFDTPGSRRTAPGPTQPAAAAVPKATRAGKSQARLLEQELAASREYLQSVIQELEAANEELQSANEEILSSNEELQSTNEELDTAKEELQSTNEELNTVNEELQGRNDELSRVNSDLLNLLGSVQIAIVIIGPDMRIRRFTPMAEKVLNLIPTDVDRSIGHINPNFEGASLEKLIAECIDNIALVEQEVRDREGRWYALRVRPYRSAENKIDGAVVALFDIDALKRHEATLRSATELTQALLRASPLPMALLDAKLHLRYVNTPFVTLFGLDSEGVQGRSLAELLDGSSGLERLSAKARDGDSKPIALELRPPPSGAPIVFQAQTLPAFDGAASHVVLLVATNSADWLGATR